MANVFGKGYGYQSNDHEVNTTVSYQGIVWGTHQGVTYSAKKLVLKVRPKVETEMQLSAYLTELINTNSSPPIYGTTFS